jgi:HB1, ASXL, restriction endonuclease HTH domain/Restriction endonuclease
MTFTDAAREVLTQEGRPLHYKEITELAIDKNLLSHVGKSPEVTMGARLAATLKKGGDDNALIRVKPGVFALRDWDEDTIKLGMSIKRAPAKRKKKESEPPEEEAAPKATAKRRSRKKVEDEAPESDAAPAVVIEEAPPSADETMRAEIAASVSEVFEDEEDDDEPLLAPPKSDDDRRDDDRRDDDSGREPRRATKDSDREEDRDGGRKRRRRRRRRGRSSNGEKDDGTLPTYTATPVEEDSGGTRDASRRGPQVIELGAADVPSLDGLAGGPLADVIALILGTFDRTVGAVSLRQITDTAARKGKLTGDPQLAQAHVAAAVRADNARRRSLGLRPRFRVAGGRVGLTEWLLDNDLARYERELLQALNRYREASHKAFARKVGELPGHAFVELCMMVLERARVTDLNPVKFAGASGAETQFGGTLHTPAGSVSGQVGDGQGMRLAVVIRKDGRDLGRERVTELRGSAHHFGGASIGWLFTAGQILSGAREEASLDHAMPVTLLGGMAIARLCDELDVAVVRSTHPIAVPDVDLFEALRSS